MAGVFRVSINRFISNIDPPCPMPSEFLGDLIPVEGVTGFEVVPILALGFAGEECFPMLPLSATGFVTIISELCPYTLLSAF